MCDCEKCRHCDIDYIWDEEEGDEYPLYICEKGHSIDEDENCEDFKERRYKPYKEKDTKCDRCKCIEECKSKNLVMECTTTEDTRKHYIAQMGVNCKLEV